MEEIKINDYIKTKSGNIYKVRSITKFSDGDIHIAVKEQTIFLRPNDIAKHSKNIIDLIEIGDYVNGRLVLQVDYKNKNVCLLIPLTDTKANTNIMWYGYEDIRTVVTKEMMKSVEYRVETE